jgi:hypothetical protein
MGKNTQPLNCTDNGRCSTTILSQGFRSLNTRQSQKSAAGKQHSREKCRRSCLTYGESVYCATVHSWRHIFQCPVRFASTAPISSLRLNCRTSTDLHKYIRIQSVPHMKHIMSRLQTQRVNAVYENSSCWLWEPYGTHKYTLWAGEWDI